MLLSSQSCLKALYFQYPSLSHGEYFSHEDRTTLFDLAKFGILIYWVDLISGKILQYVPKPEKDSGMFVPIDQIETFSKATFFGVYGSNLRTWDLENELEKLLAGIRTLSAKTNHPL